MHIDREKIGKDQRQNELHGDTERGTHCSSDETHGGGLRNVDRQHLTARSTEAAQHGDRVDFALDECAHTAGDSDTA